MKIRHLELENVTVFDKIEIAFDEGINIFIGENGTGKTHILKILYAACQAADPKTSFSAKIVRTMLPDEFKISRLITRKPGNHNSEIKVSALSEKKQKIILLQLRFIIKQKNGMRRFVEKKPGKMNLRILAASLYRQKKFCLTAII